MADVVVHDYILHNILVRLPAKSLLRFRCVSRHWNRLISEPYFMKSRSRRMMMLSTSLVHLVDDNLPIDDPDHSILNLCSPFGLEKDTQLTAVGASNGIVLMVLTRLYKIPPVTRVSPKRFGSINMILYNPLTRDSRSVWHPRFRFMNDASTYAFGFGYGYGETPDDHLKIFAIDQGCEGDRGNCHVLDLQQNSWSMRFIPKYKFYDGMAGTFLNGFLYWVAHRIDSRVILALNVKEMIFSEIDLPHPRNCTCYLLGSLNGRLCIISGTNFNEFHVWVMREQGVWGGEVCSFKFTSEAWPNMFYPVYVFDDGRVLMADGSSNLFIYDTSKHSTKSLIFVSAPNFEIVRGIEYVESLISPGANLPYGRGDYSIFRRLVFT